MLLPAYLLALGFGQFEVGVLGTATLAGSALATIAVGSVGHRWPQHQLLLAAALRMAATGAGSAGFASFWLLALLFARSALSQMDVPTRTAYVMAVVTPAERAAAASLTAVPRSLASAASPSLGGALLAAGFLAAALILCGSLKIAYDLALLLSFRHHKGHQD